MKPNYQRTKIIATVGPASQRVEMLEQLIMSGVDVFRLNMSHGNIEQHLEVVRNIKYLNEKHGLYIGIIADLQGPKIRIGEIADNKLTLSAGDTLTITTDEIIGNHERISISYKDFAKDVKPKDIIMIDDGKVHFEVISTDKIKEVKAKAINDGVLSGRKGVNLPNTKISLPSLTDKDKANLEAIVNEGIQWIALSFVRSASDIIELKYVISQLCPENPPKIIAKIEKPEAVKGIDEIIENTDAVMVARGDLGVEIPLQEVPLIQKYIVKKCLKHSKPVIIATQMMESMIKNITPTRAEVNDVANSVMDGADALMLSGETSVGDYPAKVVETMQKIIERIEQYEGIYHKGEIPKQENNERYIADATAYTACNLARQSHAKALIGMTHSGYTAFKLSSFRPLSNIFIFTNNKELLTTLSLVWGVRGFYYDKYISTDHTIEDIKHFLKHDKLIESGDYIVNVTSMPIQERGTTNTVKLSKV